MAVGRIDRLTWHVAVATVGGRALAVVGWNIPLARPTGLTSADQVGLGEQLAGRLQDLGQLLAPPSS